MDIKRVFLIVLDSFGCGDAPDASLYGDEGSDTLASVSKSSKLHIPHMISLGLSDIDGVLALGKTPAPKGAFGRLTERSAGKDTVTGHWELAGVTLSSPFPTYPQGFPKEIIDELSRITGKEFLCNLPYSGTQLLLDYGKEHIKTGKLILYTSGDSVMQIAAHEDIVPIEELYDICKKARELMKGEHAVGRIIARPFVGEYPNFTRTANRRDFALTPPAATMLDVLCASGFDCIGVGKIEDIFAGQGLTRAIHTGPNDIGMKVTDEIVNENFNGLCFINLVDFDSVYGHRNDCDGYAEALSRFDLWLGGFLEKMRDEDVLMITADHGCDPLTPSTDHSRERVPLLVYGKSIKAGTNIKTRDSFADVAATCLHMLGAPLNTEGISFFDEIRNNDCY